MSGGFLIVLLSVGLGFIPVEIFRFERLDLTKLAAVGGGMVLAAMATNKK